MNFYPHHIGDYLSATAHLSWVEDCAYRRLLDAYYTREAPLPGDVAACCRLVRAVSKEERRAVEVILSEFFHIDERGWTHRRCDAEIEKATSKRSKAAESANKRWQSGRNANAYANALPTQSDGNAPNPNPNPNTPLPPDDGGGESDLPAAVRLSIEARRHGLQTQGGDPRLITLGEQGVTPETLRAAIEEAKRAKGGAVPSLGYVVAVLTTWASQATKIAANGAAQPIRGGGVIALQSSATPDDAVLRRISTANGGEAVQRLPDGRYRCGLRYYRPNGVEELAI